ncbi:hypothetical protein INT43_003802 [Umbelopsis isabellina]|uniref:Transmembrane 9 superfamily member n=1 Tax=Mortierella isabellina TaxID=91625 RepID=A0A8H7PUJ6_MORIS|nr:hypothetical protein INT43_003802 [Umbelopsis isabellina]
MAHHGWLSCLLALFLLVNASVAFYLPGVAPHNYKKGDQVPLYVNSLTPIVSSNSQLKSVISYDYYYDPFHFCQPEGGPEKQSESLGSILFGDRIFNSPFQINMMEDVECKLLCTTSINKEDAEFMAERVKENYAINWLIDGLPAARQRTDERGEENKQTFYGIGFELGYMQGTNAHINNHYHIEIMYHTREEDNYRVVGVLVFPQSINNQLASGQLSCSGNGNGGQEFKYDGKDTITYTYRVAWKESTTPWATRWDNYLHIFDPSIHWFSLVNSIVIVLFLTGMVAMILLRALHKDISRYNAVDAQEDVQEDYGWKLVHGDVFRPPTRSMFLAVLVGNGAQLVAMAGVTLVFAVLGFLSPSNRGSLATVMVILFMVFGSIAGFVSARVYKMNGGEAWKVNVALTAVLFPGVILGELFGLNFFLIASHSSGAVPFGSMIAVLALWCLISLPLSVIGSYFGFRKPRIEHPVRTNQIPRQIPDQPFYLRTVPSVMMGGLLPFGAIFIELYFIMNSIWFHRIYYGLGFLFLVYSVLILTCAEITILMCYFHLCNEDYHWSWRAFFTSGASGLYVFLYSALYYFTKLDIGSFTGTVLYFGYSAIISVLVTVMTGAVGYVSTLIFLQRIFASIKVD